MPPNVTPHVSFQQSNGRKRPASERVVPAIPLALSKPKSAKPKPKAESDTRGGAEKVPPDVQTAEPSNVQQKQESATHGEAHCQRVDISTETLERTETAMRLPTADTPGSHGSAPMSLSNGGTPEMPTTGSTRPSTPPPVQQTSATVSPASSRKPTDRFDMRHIRTELPPAFVPSAGQHTPRSAASSQSNRPPSFFPHAHPHHPSTSSIVFGGQDSSNSSPAPPQSAGSAVGLPSYPTLAAAQQPYFIPQGHAHHTSEPHAQRMYHPGYPQPSMPWGSRQSYQQATPHASYFHPHGNVPFRYPPREVFTPSEPPQPNRRDSRSRSASQASSGPDQQNPARALQSPLGPESGSASAKAMFPEPKAAFPGQSYPRQPHFNHQMPPPPQFQHPDVALSFENMELLSSHVRSSFSDPAFADCQLEITDNHESGVQHIDAHRVILGRSPTLLMLIENSAPPSSSMPTTQVHVRLKGQYLRSNAFMQALKYIYGGPPTVLDYHRPSSSAGGDIPSNVDRMERALQHLAVGAWLEVGAMASRGVDVAGNLLHWDTITTVLAFSLDGGLSSNWTVDDGSEDRSSTSSNDDSLGRSDSMSAPTYDPYSTNLLHRIIDFTVHMLPPNFYLDASAPQLVSCPRLPPLPLRHENRPSRSDPRLSQIRFGEIPVEDHQRPSFAMTTISSVLLTLPFPLLKCVLEHDDLAARLGPETVASIMRQVVAEREVRRAKVLKARVAGQVDETADAHLVQNLYWTESVEPSAQHRAGFRLARRKRDIDTPPSSGACSEHNK